MTMNKVFAKLRKNGKTNYRQLKFCYTFAVFLITIFISIVNNSAVKNVLPQGGDSLKQVYMIFSVALIGCLVFTVYAGNLFLRYKSKEIGVFLAMGTPKKQISRALYGDLLSVIGRGIGFGIVSGTCAAFLILKIFQWTVSVKIEKVSFLSLNGSIISLLFGCVAGICILFSAARFMRRTNIMDIINEDRKNEKLNQNVNRKYVIWGICGMVLGLLVIGVLVPIYTRIAKRTPGLWTYLFFIFVVWGIYRIMVYSISVHKRGKNPQKYYKNIISYGMLKFQGSSIAKNMLVITLLIICTLFACLYTPGQYMLGQKSAKEAPIDFNMSYLRDADQIDRNIIDTLAKKNEVEITEYHEVNFIRLLGSGVNRENTDADGKLIEKYEKRRYYYSFVSAKQYNEITNSQIEIDSGHYRLLVNGKMHESIYNKYDDLDYVENPYTGESLEMKYDGNTDGNGMEDKSGFDVFSRYVINDQDYELLAAGLPDDKQLCNVMFNVKNVEESYPFAQELYRIFCEQASESMLHLTYYDEYQEETALEQEGYYGYGESITVDAEHSEDLPDWKYTPNFKILEIKNGFFRFAIFYLLFIVVTIICLAAVGIVSYTRSISMVMSNKGTFEDIKKLGANEAYISKVLRRLIKKVYLLPTIVGCLAMIIWYPSMLWQNDGRLSSGEGMIIMLEVLLCIGMGLYQGAFYWLSIKKGNKIIQNEFS